MFRKRSYVITAIAAAIVVAAFAAAPSAFISDSVFKATNLSGWHTLGQADWRVENGEIVGTPKSPGGGWLVLDKSYQDVGFFASFRCAEGCKTGVLFRAAKTPEGMSGVLVSLNTGDLASYNVKLDAQGQETSRDKLGPFGGGQIRYSAQAPPPAPGRGGAGRAGSGRGGAAAAASEGDMAEAPAGRGSAAGGASGYAGRAGRPTGLSEGEWNTIQVIMDADIIRPSLTQAGASGGGRGGIAAGVTGDGGKGYGPVALFVGGTGAVRFKDVSFKDLNSRGEEIEQVSKNFRMQRISDYFYSRGATAGDFNHDGILDIASGPYIYLGPSFTERKEIELATTFSPSTSYPDDNANFAYDFTGDGWDDILVHAQNGSRPVYLYVNPRGESRRWDKYMVIPSVTTEDVYFKDIDGDGKPEVIYGGGGVMAYAKPDPADPTKPWIIHKVSENMSVNIHGAGVGDINGDGRMDLLAPSGWWEQPAKDTHEPWAFHPEYFGHGGDEICVYDVNGDGLNDVVTSTAAHGYGLSWFEQKRDKAGTISFVEHQILGDLTTKNAGNVTFSEPHGSACADMDGDGIPDLVVGKRYFAHQDSYTDPDPYGPPVLYVYHTVRNPKAPGGAEFVPELIHNRSGVGSHVTLMDVNKDGAMDIVMGTTRGTFVFFNTPTKTAAHK
jgi:hypothetical protein